MMHDLESLLIQKISEGFKRRSYDTSSRWACAYRIMGSPYPGKWTFNHHPWLRELHESKAEINIGQKSTQMGFTETVLNIVFFKIDTQRIDCLYVLPAKTPDAKDFSVGRFDLALELSPHLRSLFSDVKNVGHKRAGSANLYIRGSKSRAGLKSIPVGLIVLDEVDEMKQENISLAFERLSGQRIHQAWLIGNPTLDNRGINKYYQESTQEEFYFPCPSCSRIINLTFPESIIITAEYIDDPKIINSYLKCKECDHVLHHQDKELFLKHGYWISNKYNNRIDESSSSYNGKNISIPRGFHISQLYSPTISPIDLARAYLRSLTDKADEQTFYNDKLGLPHAVEGARLTDYEINSCKGDHLNNVNVNVNDSKLIESPNRILTLGIDVGKYLHYEVDEWKLPNNQSNGLIHKINDQSTDINTSCKVKVIEIGKLDEFEQLDYIMHKYRITSCVIDANPERRKAYEFASRFQGHVKLCFYGSGLTGRQLSENRIDTSKSSSYGSNEPIITVDRTSWLDLSLGRFKISKNDHSGIDSLLLNSGTISIPKNTPLEYQDHLKSPVRSYEKDRDGNPVGRYIKSSGEDHYAHARNYAEIALRFAILQYLPHTISDLWK